ncbi:phosphoribosyl-AMP cyclohydrolase [Qipengyuania sp. CAU 1752]
MNTNTHETDRESGSEFLPKFDASGLVAGVVQHAKSNEILMLAFLDAEALEATRETGLAHFHSRSRGTLWKKGETSGNVLQVTDILVDCDQDALVIKAIPAGPACHTGARSCFYRRLEGTTLVPALA